MTCLSTTSSVHPVFFDQLPDVGRKRLSLVTLLRRLWTVEGEGHQRLSLRSREEDDVVGEPLQFTERPLDEAKMPVRRFLETLPTDLL